jgi:hypothetical protein
MKIVIIIPYFGSLPFWMSFFLLSCKYNPTINFIIITDFKYDLPSPSNVEFRYMTYDSYCELVSIKLDINFKPLNSYKLCDIRPAIGLIHDDLIQEYDFWGFGDLDLIYGDLRTHFTEKKLQRKKIISSHQRRVSGHLCIFKNELKINTAFKKIKNWKSIFEDQRHWAFDERAFSKIFIRHKNLPQVIRNFLKLFNPWLRIGHFVELYTTPNARIKWIDGTSNFPATWFWSNGKVTNNLNKDLSFPYFHFMVWKKSWKPNFISCDINSTKFFSINVEGFFEN